MTKEELEKEAEEYAHTKHCKKCSSHCEKKCILVKDDYETFKQGAEFGYNKANEELQKAKEIIKAFLDSSDLNIKHKAEEFLGEF